MGSGVYVKGLTSGRCDVARKLHVLWRVCSCSFNFLIKDLSVENMKAEVLSFYIYIYGL